MSSSPPVQWPIAVLAVFGAFLVFGIGLTLALAAALPPRPAAYAADFATALAVVSVAYASAPRGKLGFAALCFVLGAVAALALVGPLGLLHPDFDPSGGPADWVPFGCTLAGGALGLLCALRVEYRIATRA